MKKQILRTLAIFCLIAILASVGGSAFAEEAKFTSTKNFLAYLDENGIDYTYYGVNGKYEEVDITRRMDNYPSLTCEVHFREDCEEVSLRIWDIIKAKADKEQVCAVLNTLNDGYKFVKFVYDESDATVQGEIDMYIDGDHCGRSVYDAMWALFDVVDSDDAAKALDELD